MRFLFLALTILSALLVLTTVSQAADRRLTAVKRSPLVKAIQRGLQAEQGLTCAIARDEEDQETIQFLEEDGRSKFILLLLCDTGESAIIKGVIGDGGQTRVEEFRLTWAQ